MCTGISWQVVKQSFGFRRCGVGTESCIFHELLVHGPLWVAQISALEDPTSATLESGEPTLSIPGQWRVPLSLGQGTEERVEDFYTLPSSTEFLTGLKREANKISQIRCYVDSWMTFPVFKGKGHAFLMRSKSPHGRQSQRIFRICFAFTLLYSSKGKFQLIISWNNYFKGFIKKDLNVASLENLGCN